MKLMERFRKVFAAASFAEVGEWDTARQIMNQGGHARPAKRAKKRLGQRRQPRPRVYRA